MKVNVANPIYDTVFKYLMEDERIARTLLSALLQKNVVEVKVRPHEYSNTTKDSVSLFRIDFSATVREDDGKINHVLVELQKAWVETETLRFRQYLGAQYSNPDNMLKYEKKDGMVSEEKISGYAIPMITIYILGHRVGDIEEPVVYVNHDVYDYYGKPVTKGIPDPFVNSLVHDSIIVQIPRLRGHVNNRLDLVLSIFDQTQKDTLDRHMLTIDEGKYKGDPDMEHIVHRLLAAASNHDVRMRMNVEDEFFLALENRDTAISNRDKRIKEQDAQLALKDEQLSKKDEQLSKKDELINQQQSLMRKMVKSMIDKGMDIEEISTLVNMKTEDVRKIVK